MTELKTFLITVTPAVPAFLATLESPSTTNVMTTFLLPVILFIFSKTIDVLVQLYLKRKGKNG